jgi:hypothetical protein
MEFLTEQSEKLKEFFIKYVDGNPIAWILVFAVGIGVFKFTMEALKTTK